MRGGRSSKDAHGLLVNATSGEPVTLTLEEKAGKSKHR